MALLTRLGKKKPAKNASARPAPAPGPVATVASPPMAGLAVGANRPSPAWTRGRTGGGPSGAGPMLGAARARSAEQPLYGNAEQPETEHEEEIAYNDFSPEERSNPNAYSRPIPQLPVHEEEDSPYNNFGPEDQPHLSAYSRRIPHVEEVEQHRGAGAAGGNAYSVQIAAPAHEPAPQRAGAPLPSLAAKSARGPAQGGNSRQHRAFALQKLGSSYEGESDTNSPKGKSNPGTLIGPRLKAIAKLSEMAKQSTFSEADRAYLSGLGKDGTLLATDEELAVMVAELHAKLLETLRRQDFTVTDDGVALDASNTPYPLDGNGYPIIGDRSVGYDDKDAQEKTLVEFRGGQLVRGPKADKDAGKPVDTKDSVTHFTGPGWEIFVVDQNNNIHMSSHKVGKFHHSSLVGGGEVSMAGELKVSGGKIEIMSNKSGHYLPTEEMLVQFLHFLEKDGVPLDFTVKLLTQGGERTAKQMLEGKVDGVTADPKKTYEVVKTNVVWRAFVEEFGEEAVMAVIRAQGWRGKGADIVDKDNKPVDPKLVRRLLKQELGGSRRTGKVQAKVQVQEQKLVGGRPVLTDTKWQ